MSTSVFQMRVDDELKREASTIYEQLGIDLPTAVRIFLKCSVLVGGIPFGMTLPHQNDESDSALQALYELSRNALQNGTADMTLDEINAEITASRADRTEQGNPV